MAKSIGITSFAVRRAVTTIVIVLAALYFGFQSYRKMGLELLPNADIPIVSVTTVLNGASPEVIDRDVTDVLEDQINTINGIKNITSTSYEGRSVVVIEFVLERDIDMAAADVRAKVNLAKYDLPEDCEDSIVDKFDISGEPVMTVGVSGGKNYNQRAMFADDVMRPQLQTISGVGSIDMVGFYDREIRIWLDPAKMDGYDLTASDIALAVGNRHLELPGGRIEAKTQEFSIRVEGEYADVDALSRLVVKEDQGKTVRLRDIGTVKDGLEDQRTGAFLNNKPVIALKVRKQQGENEVEVCRRVDEKLAQLKKAAPPGVEITVCSNTSEFIHRSMQGVQKDLFLGVLLTAMLMFFFLKNIRVTLVAIVSIPTSIISAFSICKAMDITVNNLTMLAMSLAIGMVIDNTIVVIENIFRHLEEGKTIREAALEGTGEVGFAVMAGTVTTIAVFYPVATMKGVIGRFFFCFGITIVTTMIISLIVSLTLTPFMASHLMKKSVKEGWLYHFLDAPMKWLESVYRTALKFAVNHRWITMLIALASFVGGIMMASTLGQDFAPDEDQGQTNLAYELPIGVSTGESERLTKELTEIILEQPETVLVLATYGSGAGEEINKGQLFIKLLPSSQREVGLAEYEDRLRVLLAGYRDVIFQVQQDGPSGADAEQTLVADSLEELALVSGLMMKKIKATEGFADVSSDLRLTKPMVKVRVNRDLADSLGVDIRTIATEINSFFGGSDVAVFNADNNRYDIRIQALSEKRAAIDDLSRVKVRSASGEQIRLGTLLNIKEEKGPNLLKRYNRRYAATIGINTVGDLSAGEAVETMKEIYAEYAPDDGSMALATTGNSEMMRESFQYLIEAIIMALIIVYVVMAIQFESFLHPFTVMGSLPLAFSGVFGICMVLGMSIDIMTFLGMILLVGIVVNNAILLVDFANQQRELGLSPKEAMLEAGPLRLRPIIMTAASTMISSLPIALALSEGSEFRQPMSVAVIGGMFTSTLLTLLVIPVLYLIMDDITCWIKDTFGHLIHHEHHEKTSQGGGK